MAGYTFVWFGPEYWHSVFIVLNLNIAANILKSRDFSIEIQILGFS